MSADPSRLILAVFRAEAALTGAIDRLVADLGLSRARWQVLGAMQAMGAPATLSQIGRAMGLSRQSVRRTVSDLSDAGLIAYQRNPAHARAALVSFTDKGREALVEASRRQAAWATELAGDTQGGAMIVARQVLLGFVDRLEPADFD